jgi:hypothetical protein
MSGSTKFAKRYGHFAIVAGAAEGIGAAFARELAARGLSLLLVDRLAEPLDALADELRGRGVAVRTARVDLAAPDVGDRVASAADGLEVGLLVYNAGISHVGPFLDRPIEDELRALDVNARGALVLAHRFAGPMAARGRGGVLLMSSVAGRQGTPFAATYAATKAFDLVLAESLWGELRPRGVDVLACCPGPTRTPGMARSGPVREVRTMEPDAVAVEALDALGGPPSMVPGFLSQLGASALARVIPRGLAVRIVGRQMRALYGIAKR